MMGYQFGEKSRQRMQGVHPDLVAVMERAISVSPIDFTVLEGLRTRERQKQLVADGKSQTMNSRHLTGHAIDVAPFVGGEVSWDWEHYHTLAPVIKQAARDLGVDLEWGGDWKSFKDGPHWQLSWATYGRDDMSEKRKKPRTSAAQSTTVQASVVQGATAIGGAVGALTSLDGTAQVVALVGCFAVLLLAGWIFKERLRKWAAGVK